MSESRHEKGATSHEYRCRWNQWLPLSIVGSSGCPSRSFWMRKTTQKHKSSSNAGQRGAVTIATNMPWYRYQAWWRCSRTQWTMLSGLRTSRKSRRMITNFVDVQDVKGIRWRSQFYLSLEDELMRRFGSERIKAVPWSLSWAKKNQSSVPNMFTTSGRGCTGLRKQLRYP